jgi:nitrite reductase/ring-hydroxylating ferredoxin subunit
VGDIPVAKPSPIPRTLRLPRRGLAIALVFAGVVALIVVAAIAAYPTGSKVDQVTGPHWVTVARADDLQVDQPLHIFEQKLWLVKLDSGEVLALSHKDPRRGCTVPWRPDFVFSGIKGWFRDPCYGSTYDLNGHKVFGPSPRGLDQYQVQVNGGEVAVWVGPGIPAIQNAPVEAKPYRPHH